jgi:predicted TIM-barrel fold metal-dependent hydrolase
LIEKEAAGSPARKELMIDMHVHIFPDYMSGKAVARLEEKYNMDFIADPTVSDLLDFMELNHIDFSVIQPVSTSVLQVEAINDWLVKTVDKYRGRIGAFGTIHPDFGPYRDELKKIKEGGLKGVKFHPNFQSFYPDDEEMTDIYREIVKNDLWVLFHAGDEVTPVKKLYSNIDSFINLRSRFPDLKIILAHMGGFKLWEEVEKKIIGRDFYLDVSYTLGFLDASRIKEMIFAHGTERILFGTDFPLALSRDQVKDFIGLGLDKDTRQKILSGNVKKNILGNISVNQKNL